MSKKIRHHQIINSILEKRGYKSYLEIGLGNGYCFRRIRCKDKVGVDPKVNFSGTKQQSSDEFFASTANRSFDFIFIDGLHEYRQVLRDVINGFGLLSENGSIMVHDCDPINKKAQQHPRQVKAWNGDVWRAWIHLRNRSDIHQVCIREDYGCGIISYGHQPALDVDPQMSYEMFHSNRQKLLNLISWEEYENNYLLREPGRIRQVS